MRRRLHPFLHACLSLPKLRPWLGVLACTALGAHAEVALTEGDFFEPVPVVLTVTRLAQPLSDTPGAVTVIDRETIRRSGARNLAEVLRLVPGYLVSGYNGANPVAAYHAPIDDFGTRNLVLVDGRSLYSSTYLGGTNRGMASVAVEEVERIEVLRGSNSAAYGANALFGVINIITRHALDTVGRSVSVTRGQAGIADAHVRLGWGDATAAQRLSLSHRSDTGYAFVNDDTRQTSLKWRGDFQWSPGVDVTLQAGVTDSRLGEGLIGKDGNPLRTVSFHNRFLSAQGAHRLAGDEQFKWSASWDEDRNRDTFVSWELGVPVVVGSSFDDRRLNLEFQHQMPLTDTLRWVWGAGWKEDSAVSPQLFNTSQRVRNRETRAFANAEWRFAERWLLNAGLFVGDDESTGTYAAPRLMFNYQWLPDHTLRFGVSQAKRPPTLTEQRGDVRVSIPLLLPYPLPLLQSRQLLRPERLSSHEVSYYGRWPASQLSLDVRAYEERLSGQVGSQRQLDRPIYFPWDVTKSKPYYPEELINGTGLQVRGIEYQLAWEPHPGTKLLLNQSFSRLTRPSAPTPEKAVERLPPSQLTTIAWLQQLPQQWDFTLFYYGRSSMTWRTADARLPNAHRVDARLARPFQWNGTRAEAALTVQALNGDQVEFTTKVPSVFTRRAFATLSMEF